MAAANEDQCPVPASAQEVNFENDQFKYTGQAIAKSVEGGEVECESVNEPLTIDNYVKHGQGLEINKEEGTRYEGQFKNGKHHGKGKLTYELTGDCYDGNWVDNDIDGEGKFTFGNGDVFEGEFSQNCMKTGVLNKANGDEYAGDFVKDLYSGYSLYKYANGDIYCGDFLDGKKDGDGVLKIKSTGMDFAGRFINDELIGGQCRSIDGTYTGPFAPKTHAYQGRGLMVFKSGDKYEGKWHDGLMHGHGTFVYADIFEDDSEESEEEKEKDKEDPKQKIQSMFVGEFVRGQRFEGTLTYSNGDEFVGIFDEDGLRESGGIQYINGDEFAGLFKNGAIKCGILTQKSGDVYSGEFEEGQFHGAGKMIYENGDVFQGEFEKGAKHGSGSLTLAKKKPEDASGQAESEESKQTSVDKVMKEQVAGDNEGVYIGEFYEDQMHGNGTFTFSDSSEYIGRFKNGQQHGQGILKLKDGTEMLGLWENGDQISVEYSIDVHDEGGDEETKTTVKEGGAEVELKTDTEESKQTESESTTQVQEEVANESNDAPEKIADPESDATQAE